MNSSIYERVLHQEYSHASLYALRFKTHFHTEVKQIITSLFPQPSPPFEGRGVPDKRQQKHVTKVSPNTLSGLEATLLPRSGSGGPGPRPKGCGPLRAAGGRPGVRPQPRGGETGRQGRAGERAPPETTGLSADGERPVTFSCSSRSRATSGARSGAAAEAWGLGSGGASMKGMPGPQRGERVLNKCLWKRRGRRLPSARVLALMHCAPRAEEAAPAFSATAATAALVRAARGRISHAHAARRCSRRRRRGLGAAGRPLKARSADPVAGPRDASCGGRASSAPPP